MVLEYPLALLALALLPAIWMLRNKGWGRPFAVNFPEIAAVRQTFRSQRSPGRGPQAWLRLLAIGLLVLAASRPRWLHSQQPLSAVGSDLMLALDISGSMSARDFEPLNRLQAAKQVLREFIGAERNNRLGLVAFAAQAYIVCPLTLDYQALLGLLDHLDIGMTSDGTALGMAMATALNRLKTSDAKSKAMILLTDGRNNTGALDPLTAAQMSAALQVRVYTIGMGQPAGGPIWIDDPLRGRTMLLNDDGSVHLERLDETMLRQIARITGGRYFRAGDRNKLTAIYREIAALERQRLWATSFQPRQDTGQFFIGWALIMLALEILVMPAWAPWP